MRPSQAREQRDRRKVEIGERLRLFVEDPLIEQWFAQARAANVEEMVGAAVMDDDARRGAALKIKALDELWTFMKHAVSDGKRAADDIDARERKSDDKE